MSESERLDGRRYWHVMTGYDNNDRDENDLGVHFGSLSEVAWYLADKAHGFYMDHGYLEFTPVPPPPPKGELLKPGKQRKVNIRVCTTGRKDVSEKGLRELVAGTDSRIEPSNYYGMSYLVRP